VNYLGRISLARGGGGIFLGVFREGISQGGDFPEEIFCIGNFLFEGIFWRGNLSEEIRKPPVLVIVAM